MTVQTKAKSVRRSRGDAGLSPELIVAETLALIDEQGLEAFNLRSLSRRLSVFPSAIYWHVAGRNELLARAVDAAFDTSLEGRFASWQDDLRHIFREFRATLRKHPNLAPLIGAQLIANMGVNLDLVEAILAALSRAGFRDQMLASAYNAVVAMLVGFTTQEFAQLPVEDLAGWQEQVRGRIETVDRARYPTLGANLPALANKVFILRWQNGVDNPLDAGFFFSVETLLAGLAAMAPQTS